MEDSISGQGLEDGAVATLVDREPGQFAVIRDLVVQQQVERKPRTWSWKASGAAAQREFLQNSTSIAKQELDIDLDIGLQTTG